eukprot:TRINITY_DN27827_c0_g2_i1.p6 TRINITY_DN27827_c0_g2~~TRINITY_DN27827_c0_g2_i1.p6  ORF type:complete len:126 (+),score=3.59 TRINITY_DN27827_c0_g2_i1:1604-1981(+)
MLTHFKLQLSQEAVTMKCQKYYLHILIKIKLKVYNIKAVNQNFPLHQSNLFTSKFVKQQKSVVIIENNLSECAITDFIIYFLIELLQPQSNQNDKNYQYKKTLSHTHTNAYVIVIPKMPVNQYAK